MSILYVSDTHEVIIAPLTLEVTLRMSALTTLPDIHDRLIVAEAQQWGAGLITRDREIQQSGLIQTVW